MNDDELMSRLHRLADEDRARDPDPAGDRGFWQGMADNVAADYASYKRQAVRRRRWLGVSLGGSTALLAMAAALLLYVRVQHRRPAHGEDVIDDDAEVFQDEDVGELTEGLDQQQLERVANALKKGV